MLIFHLEISNQLIILLWATFCKTGCSFLQMIHIFLTNVDLKFVLVMRKSHSLWNTRDWLHHTPVNKEEGQKAGGMRRSCSGGGTSYHCHRRSPTERSSATGLQSSGLYCCLRNTSLLPPCPSSYLKKKQTTSPSGTWALLHGGWVLRTVLMKYLSIGQLRFY